MIDLTEGADRAGARRPPRVLVGPLEVAGYYTRLAANLREAGADAVAVDLSGHPFRYDRGPRAPAMVRLAERSRRLSAAAHALPWLLRVPFRGLSLTTRVLLLLWALSRFDAFIFGFGQTFFSMRELPLLRRAGKKIIFVFNGSDARPPYIDGALMPPSAGRPTSDCLYLTQRQKARIRRIEAFASAIVSQPAISHFFERPIADFYRMGMPWVEFPAASISPSNEGPVRIVHSPSNPEVKGSARIRDEVAGLVGEGLALELIELRGRPNDEVRRQVAAADFVVDQIYSDAPMSAFATEAAVAGKASIVGGYAWETLQRIYPGETMPPVEQCRPEGLREAIRRLATDTAHRERLGQEARTFVTERWARREIGMRFLALIDGSLGLEYYFDPSNLDYVQGVGLEEDQARDLVRRLLALGGRASLQLEDKPGLEQKFVDFAEALN